MDDAVVDGFATTRREKRFTRRATKRRLRVLDESVLRADGLGRKAFTAMTTIERLLVVVLLAMSEQQLLGRELLAAKATVKAMQLQHVLTKSDFAF